MARSAVRVIFWSFEDIVIDPPVEQWKITELPFVGECPTL
jgi:hypothetical protein